MGDEREDPGESMRPVTLFINLILPVVCENIGLQDPP